MHLPRGVQTRVVLYDATGRTVFSQKFSQKGTWPCAPALGAGMYVLSMQVEGFAPIQQRCIIR
ncbi:MAG: hypothetical protein GF350_08480 [Chitinivibrionales bacterium]|nr:hypothetical protein [Chitinivibrionales bacterium]